MASPSPRKLLTRDEALGGIPERFPVESLEETPGGGLRLKVKFSRPGWQRWLGMPETAEHSFELDALGREVYESCDGRRDVSSIARILGEAKRISPVEAEISVTTFLKMLIRKGLVGMQVPAARREKKKPGKGGRS